MNKEKILVTGTGSLIGQAIIKSLKLNHFDEIVSIIGCDYFENTPGSFWCEKHYILPDLLDNSLIDAWKVAIKQIIEKEQIKAILIGVDFELGFFAELREELYELYGCTVLVSDKNVIDVGNDKYNTYKFLLENGISAPSTSLLENTNISDFEFPLIIKPRVGARSRGVHLVKNIDEYEKLFPTLVEKGYIVQQYIGTPKTEYSCGILYYNNEFKNSIVLNRVLKEGNTSFAEYNESAEQHIIKQYIKKIGDALKPYGSCNLQLRIDNNGEPYLFEINPRFSGTTYMRALLGYNEVEYLVRQALHMDPISLTPRNGRVYRFYDERMV